MNGVPQICSKILHRRCRAKKRTRRATALLLPKAGGFGFRTRAARSISAMTVCIPDRTRVFANRENSAADLLREPLNKDMSEVCGIHGAHGKKHANREGADAGPVAPVSFCVIRGLNQRFLGEGDAALGAKGPAQASPGQARNERRPGFRGKQGTSPEGAAQSSPSPIPSRMWAKRRCP